MRLRNPLLLLALVCLIPVHAIAATTRCSGLQCSSLGNTVVTSPDGRALHMQLARDGSDGARVDLSHLEGSLMQSSSVWAVTSTAQQVSLSWSTESSPITVSARCDMVRSPSSVDVTVDLSGMCSSGSCVVRQYLYFHDALVATVDLPSLSSSFVLQGGGAVSNVPSVGLQLSSSRATHAMVLTSSSLYLFGGASYDVDMVVTVAHFTPDVPGEYLSECRITCPGPTSMSVLDFSSLSFVRFGSMVSLSDLNHDGHPDLLALSSENGHYSGSFTATVSLDQMVFGSGTTCPSGTCTPLSLLDRSCSPISVSACGQNPITLDSQLDNGSSVTIHVTLQDAAGNAVVASSLQCRALLDQMVVSATLLDGRPADSVRVLSHGTEVGRFPQTCTPVACGVTVTAVPGGPPSSALKSAGPIKAGYDVKTIKSAAVEPGEPRESAASSQVTCSDLAMHATFADPRVFCSDGTCFTGDEIQFRSACPAPSSEVLTVTGTNFSLDRVSTSPPSSGLLEITDFTSSHKDQVVASVVGPPALSSTNPTVDVALDLQRVTNHGPARGVSTTLFVPSSLTVLGMDEFDLFSQLGQTAHFRTMDGLYLTFDVAILGPGCGPTGDGRFAMLHLTRTPGAPDGIAVVRVTHTDLAACDGTSLPCDDGSRAVVVLDASTVCAASTVTAQTLRSGNDGDGTTKVVLDWTLSSCTVSGPTVQLYRAPYGSYPTYQGGSTAALPTSYPPPAPWQPVSLQCSSGTAGTVSQCTDEPSTRDCYTYSLVVTDRYGNHSPFIQTNQCALDYFRGDVTNGITQCQGDNRVLTADVDFLGTYYGQQLPGGSPLACLDVAPAVCPTIECRPTPDHKLNFFDLIAYAINAFSVSAPQDAPRPTAAIENALSLDVPRLPAVGQTFDVAVRMSGAGDIQGLSASLAYDPAVLEQVGVSQGELMSRQGRPGVVLSSGPGDVDAALLGAGGGIAGEGELARVTFRMKAAGDPGLGVGGIIARDFENRDLTIAGSAPAPFAGRTALRLAFPNPFGHSTTVVFSLHASGPADVGVYDVAGRHVRTLLRGVQAAGEHTVAWDGTDDSGMRLNAGVYMLRLDAGGHSETRTLRLVK